MKLLTAPLALRVALATAAGVAAIALQLLIPALPLFLALLPAVLIAGFLGGRWMGAAALVATSLFAVFDPSRTDTPLVDPPFLVALLCYNASGGLAIALMDLHRDAVARLGRQRQRLQAALRAANAGVWEISPEGRLHWDENFYRLVGLDPERTPPTTDTFLAMVDSQDRSRMAEARRLMDAGVDPSSVDEYRITRDDGRVVWLENHRTRVSGNGSFFIGITQDITRRKLTEERVQALLAEAEHRAKNQFAVITAIARETRRASESAAAFEAAFSSRLEALSRSYDLMVKDDWRGTTLRALITGHVEPFSANTRCEMAGPEVTLAPASAQYLGMAFHELATNAAKYGALTSPAGLVRVTWEVRVGDGMPEFVLTWRESGAPVPSGPFASAGFGTKDGAADRAGSARRRGNSGCTRRWNRLDGCRSAWEHS